VLLSLASNFVLLCRSCFPILLAGNVFLVDWIVVFPPQFQRLPICNSPIPFAWPFFFPPRNPSLYQFCSEILVGTIFPLWCVPSVLVSTSLRLSSWEFFFFPRMEYNSSRKRGPLVPVGRANPICPCKSLFLRLLLLTSFFSFYEALKTFFSSHRPRAFSVFFRPLYGVVPSGFRREDSSGSSAYSLLLCNSLRFRDLSCMICDSVDSFDVLSPPS